MAVPTSALRTGLLRRRGPDYSDARALYDVGPGFADVAIQEIRGIDYARSDLGRKLRLNILRPVEKSSKPRPVIVWVHGGGWGWRGVADTYDQGTHVNYAFAMRGYFTVAIEYTLTSEAPFPAQIHDCKAAIRWLRAHAEEYHIDPEKIGVWGRSAGGHLVSLLGTSAGNPDLEGNGGWPESPSHVNAVLDYFGPTDLNSIAGPHNGEKEAHIRMVVGKFLGGPIEDRRELAELANPIRYVTQDSPPFLIIHGEKDLPVPFFQGEALHRCLASKGIESRLIGVKGAGHGLLPSVEGVPIEPALPELHAIIGDFFDRHLRQDTE